MQVVIGDTQILLDAFVSLIADKYSSRRKERNY